MSRKLYLECYSGISGDMTVAALLDLGADRDVLEKALKSIPVEGFETRISRVSKAGLDMCDFDVVLDKKHENHDHDMEYLHGDHNHRHSKNHDHSHHGDHTHDKSHDHDHKHSHDHERGLPDILEIINKTEMTENARETAVRIFQIIAKAEARVHGRDIDHVHFHEVGAVDSIVDIISVAVCLDNLTFDEIIIPVLYEGRGFIRCQHGVIPVPVPAVSQIAADCGLDFHITEDEGEFVTPTGAAIAGAIRTSSDLPKKFSITKVGMGAGKRSYKRPSILRAMFIEEDSKNKDVIVKLESNIDDCSGEVLGHAMERLFEAGAKDVSYMPVFMKKNRPAYVLVVICREEDAEKLEGIIFKETTTIGIRRQVMERSILERDIRNFESSIGKATVKVCTKGGEYGIYPEYDNVADLSKRLDMPFMDVYQLVEREAYEKL